MMTVTEDIAATEARLHRYGLPDGVRIDSIRVGPPGPGEVRLRQGAIGVNFHDVLQARGVLPAERFPAGLGLEAAGTVEAVGAGVAGIAPGDRVAYATGPVGAYATHRNVAAEHVVKLPPSVGEEMAASIMMRGLSAYCLAEQVYRLKAGDVALVHAAAGGVGLLLCQWAKALGAVVIGTVGAEEKARLAAAHGCDHVLYYRREDVAARVRALTGGRGASVVYDGVGKDTFAVSMDAIARRGLFVAYGMSSGAPSPFPISLLGEKGSIYATRFRLSHYVATRGELEAGAARLFELVGSGRVRPLVGRRFPLAEAGQALETLAGGSTVGSTILVP